MHDWSDEKIRNIMNWHIERYSMEPETWQFTRLTNHHPEVLKLCNLNPGELPIVTSFITNLSWYALTTRRIIGTYYGCFVDVRTTDVTKIRFINFKGYGGNQTEIMTLKIIDMPDAQLEFETGVASMAPIYFRYILGKNPRFDLLEKWMNIRKTKK